MITVQYVGVTLVDGTVFDSTWTRGKLPADLPDRRRVGARGLGRRDRGADGGQPGAARAAAGEGGDRERELGDQTLVYVVDILAASGGPEGG